MHLALPWGTEILLSSQVTTTFDRVVMNYDTIKRGNLSKWQIKKILKRLTENALRQAIIEHGDQTQAIEKMKKRRERDVRWGVRHMWVMHP